jgi:hypothetical protein
MARMGTELVANLAHLVPPAADPPRQVDDEVAPQQPDGPPHGRIEPAYAEQQPHVRTQGYDVPAPAQIVGENEV